jgi:antirestriction protein ArdC
MKPCTVNDNAQSDESPKQDIYARITAKIVAALEDGAFFAGRQRLLSHGAPRPWRPKPRGSSTHRDLSEVTPPRSAVVQG